MSKPEQDREQTTPEHVQNMDTNMDEQAAKPDAVRSEKNTNKKTMIPDSRQQSGNKPIRDVKGRFVPGVSGNPGGRAKRPLTAALREAMDNPENIATFIKGLLKGCSKGDPRSLGLVWDRLEGSVKVMQQIDATLAAISPVEHEESQLLTWLADNEPAVLQRFRAEQIAARLEDSDNGSGAEW
jgi:hypothetical protein